MPRLVPMAEAGLGVRKAVQKDVLLIGGALHRRRERDDFETVLRAERLEPPLGIKERIDAEARRIARAHLRVGVHGARRREDRQDEAGGVALRLVVRRDHQAVGDVPGLLPLRIFWFFKYLLVETGLT